MNDKVITENAEDTIMVRCAFCGEDFEVDPGEIQKDICPRCAAAIDGAHEEDKYGK